MPTLTRKKLEAVLTHDLKLRAPIFRLERAGQRWMGSVISDSFRRQTDLQRQTRMLVALEKELGKNALQCVGMLLAFTPEEWNFDEKPRPSPTPRRTARNGHRN